MKSSTLACAVILTLLGPRVTAQEPKGPETKQARALPRITEQILDMEQRLRAANLRRDVSFFQQTLSNDYVAIGSRGNTLGKVETIKNLESGDLKFDSIEYSHQKVRVYGNTAIVTGTLTTAGHLRDRNFMGTYVYTRVYVRTGRSWKIVSFHATRPPSP